MLAWVSQSISALIDFFYPPFKRYIPIQTFRYIACGGGNTFLDILIYFISYNYILDKQDIYLGFNAFGREAVISSPIMAFIISFCITFPLGFFLNRTVVFNDSVLRGRVQLFRYILLVTACIFLNYIFIKLFVEQFGIYPTVAKIFTTVIVVSFSYLTQRHFTFKK
ncbi:GtrA family protein [Flavihumibacter sp. CACIAM 22H1]|uniref:GtrA family protein n=1 Tax=Flavihumibacter sp. CACIAM 22H1 TaxID=1812911 RepID=UPI0007A8DAA9|nr:GtrA family protein [Flavihumibacter sp. CACIAM 22H1]KYP15927.1 MAG: phenylalanine 4-monooxygenase [Flavihumibacter sp. CACIAM 22H1]